MTDIRAGSAVAEKIESAQAYQVLGVNLAALQIPDLVSRMESWIRARDYGHLLVFANVHVVVEAQHDPAFKQLLNDSFTVPDGKPLIWLGRKAGFPLARRVYGPDLMIDFCRMTAGKGYSSFLYGGAPGVADGLATILQRDYGTEVVGWHSPPFRPLSPEEDDEVVNMINTACPDVLWIGLGCPKQEKWAYEHLDRLKVPVVGAVGQAFDIHSGRAKQAPSWMREHGLEWVYRLFSEPRRLWKRYLVYNTEFIFRILLQSFRRRETHSTDIP
jgi:N-acetylglucosaminyldiphosphoundecaprenol N-acetyl-beta-D-mannosaminyltransferase